MNGANIFLVWMIVLCAFNLIWLVVTFITDFQAACYRKARMYRR